MSPAKKKVRESPFLTVFCCMNAIAVMTMLPVSIGGLGCESQPW